MIKLREIIPAEVIKLIKDYVIGDDIDKVIDLMDKEVHENNANLFRRHKKFVQYNVLRFDSLSVKEAIEMLNEFKEDDVIEQDLYSDYREYYIGTYENENNEEYASRIMQFFESFKEKLESKRKSLTEEKEYLEKRLKEINEQLNNE